ncbi:uncharacterized protein [Macrobrachium rosenbergii]|uniref:uncharacterized protein isoform X2 n=1 Tax=Macrobrachium rosenbergii TaxID=79674 RepID=UPI0034D4FC18
MATTRQPFSSQSTLYILLDYTDEEKSDEIEIIYKALEDTIVIGGAVVGATRLPGVGVGLLGPPFARLLKLSSIRNNLPSVLSSLSRVFQELTPTTQGTETHMEVCAALDAIVAEAERFSPALSHPLQLLVLTWRPVPLMMETFTSALTLSHSKYLRAIHVIGIASVLHPDAGDDMPPGDAAGGVWVTGATYTADPYTFNALFKSWLSESKGTEPHVQLIFPSSPGEEEEEPLTLLLDMQEIMIDPLSLPSAIASRLIVHQNLYRTTSSTQGSNLPVVELEVIKRISTSSFATALMGPPTYLLATGATSLPFDKIWDNKLYVTKVSQKLEEKNEALLARVIAPSGTVAAHVVIFPAPHCSALSMIHVVPCELMLAERHLEGRNSQLIVPEKVISDIEQKLSELEVSELRLEDHTTNLIPSLVHHFTKPARGGTARIPPTHISAVNHAAGRAPLLQARGQHGGRAMPVRQVHPALMTQPTPASRSTGRYNRGTGRLGQRALNAFQMSRGRQD